MDYRGQIKNYIQNHQEEIIDTWKTLVDSPSKVNRKEDLDVCCGKLAKLFEKLGFTVTRIKTGPANGDVISGILGEDRPGKPVMFTGHYDTVPLPGEHPFRFDEEGHVRGLGSLDMKGGITIAYHVCKMLNEIGWQERPIKILFVGDEETGHDGGNAAEVIAKEAAGMLCAFNMETGLLSNAVCIGRKGDIKTTMTVHGIAAHSGNAFLQGRSAITEAAKKIPLLEALTDLDKGTTVAVTLIEGGTVFNSIPPICKMTIDSRIKQVSERQRIFDSMKEIAEMNFIDGCTTEYICQEYMPPFESSTENRKLAQFVSDVSESLGQGKMNAIELGGGSDASHIAMIGVPALCSMGVRGEYNHTENEYAVKESVFERVELLANAVIRIHEFEQN